MIPQIPQIPQIPNNKHQELLDNIEPYMLLYKNIYTSRRFLLEVEKKKEVVLRKTPDTSINYPEYKDKLFWIFYIFKYGIDVYDNINQAVFSTEKNEKFTIVELINKDSTLLKQHKLSKLNIIDELINKPWLTLQTFEALCIYYKLNVIYIKKKIFYLMNYSDDLEYHCLYNIDDKYGYKLDLSKEKLIYYKTNYLQIPSLIKPYKSIGSYLLNDLVSMASKLNISLLNALNKKKLKKELYEDIVKIIS